MRFDLCQTILAKFRFFRYGRCPTFVFDIECIEIYQSASIIVSVWGCIRKRNWRMDGSWCGQWLLVHITSDLWTGMCHHTYRLSCHALGQGPLFTHVIYLCTIRCQWSVRVQSYESTHLWSYRYSTGTHVCWWTYDTISSEHDTWCISFWNSWGISIRLCLGSRSQSFFRIYRRQRLRKNVFDQTQVKRCVDNSKGLTNSYCIDGSCCWHTVAYPATNYRSKPTANKPSENRSTIRTSTISKWKQRYDDLATSTKVVFYIEYVQISRSWR